MNKNTPVVFLVLALVAVAPASLAQFHIGATTAFTGTAVLDKGLRSDPRYEATITYNYSPIGVSTGFDFTPKFGLQLETIVTNAGQIYDIVNTAKSVAGERNIDVSYLDLPLLLNFMGGGGNKARANFNFGPQLSFLTDAIETADYKAGVYEFPEGTDLPEGVGAVDNGDGTFTIPADVQNQVVAVKEEFSNMVLQIAGSFGLNVDLSKHLYLTSIIRFNYSLTDMRGADLVNSIKSGSTADIFGARANAVVGIQLGLHYMVGLTKSFK
jgi:hypothetical protein